MIREGKLYQLVVVPVLAPEPIAWVGLAFEVDDAVAKDLHQLTGLEVTFASRGGGTVAPARLDAGSGAAHEPPGRSRRPRMPITANLVDVGGEQYETRVVAARGAPRQARRRDPAEAARRSASRPSAASARRSSGSRSRASSLLVAGSLIIARGITRPVHRLADAAQRVQQGDYTRHVDVEHRDEIGQLAVSFNHMLDGIVSREKEILRLAYEDALTGLPNRAMFYEQLEPGGAHRASAAAHRSP